MSGSKRVWKLSQFFFFFCSLQHYLELSCSQANSYLQVCNFVLLLMVRLWLLFNPSGTPGNLSVYYSLLPSGWFDWRRVWSTKSESLSPAGRDNDTLYHQRRPITSRRVHSINSQQDYVRCAHTLPVSVGPQRFTRTCSWIRRVWGWCHVLLSGIKPQQTNRQKETNRCPEKTDLSVWNRLAFLPSPGTW